ncbi:FRAS1-related extracellular matrix protein 2-like [Amphiura filiformis]|uniref:FRAS1-related extracellular matrix protein 2-like n=1 Tax=Amphiura filiformis TaxID=82378 RepID=UPI003B21A3C0
MSTTIYIEDQSVWYYFQEQTYIVGERAATLITRVCRDGCIWDVGSVDIAFDDATDTATGGGTDYDKTDPVGKTVAFTAGVKCVDVDFNIEKDTVIEDLEFFTITLGTPVGGFISVPGVSTVFIVDETAIFWLEGQYIAHEGNNLVVTAHRKGYIDAMDVVTLIAADGTGLSPATDPADYDLPVDATITFAALATSGDSNPIVIEADAVIEDTEDFTLSLTLTGTTAMCGVVIDPDPSTVFILDRTAYFWIEERQYIIDEGDFLDVIFHRGGFLGRVDTLTLTTTDGRATEANDYDPPADGTTITFNALDVTSTKRFTIDNSNTIEHREDFDFAITVDAGSSTTGTVHSPSVSTVIIRDPTWYNFDCAKYTVWEDATSVNIAIRRFGDVTLAGSVVISTQDRTAKADSDYTALTTMTVAFGAGMEMVNVPLTILPDDIVEEEEILVMILSSPATGEALGDLYKATAMIFDDDAYYSIEKAIYFSTESTLNITSNILRFGYTGRAGTVQLSTSDVCAVSGLDYTTQTNTLVSFAAGDKSQPVTLGILNDKIVEDNEWFRFSLSNPTQGELGVIRCARVNIKDDDSLISFGDDIYHVLEDTEMAMITVKRGAYIEKDAQIEVTTVGLSAEENVDFTDVTHTIVFGVGETSVTFEVPIRNDDIVEQTESFEIRFSNMLGGQIGYPATAVVLIENEDGEF